MNIFDLSDKIAVVTGGNRGIGFGIAKGLASAGATIVIANRDAAGGQRAVESLKKEGFNATAVATDIRNIPSISTMVSEVIRRFGRIDILVNNAAIILRKPAEEISEDEWDNVMNTNLKGLFFCCQLVGREMIRCRKGNIINISSNVAKIVAPVRSVYAASKAGVSHLTSALAVEWAQYNINVNAIGAGLTMTDINKKHFEEHPEELEEFIKSIPKGRVAYPLDYVGTAVFLASEASDYVTGQTLFVEGGMTII